MEIFAAKIVALILMGTFALFFGLLPLKIRMILLKGEEDSEKRKRRDRIISGLLCFGSGVLLATVFVHMLPETREGFERLRAASKLKSSNQVAIKSFQHDHNHFDHNDSHSNDSMDDLGNHFHHSHDDNHDHDHDHDHFANTNDNNLNHNHDNNLNNGKQDQNKTHEDQQGGFNNNHLDHDHDHDAHSHDPGHNHSDHSHDHGHDHSAHSHDHDHIDHSHDPDHDHSDHDHAAANKTNVTNSPDVHFKNNNKNNVRNERILQLNQFSSTPQESDVESNVTDTEHHGHQRETESPNPVSVVAEHSTSRKVNGVAHDQQFESMISRNTPLTTDHHSDHISEDHAHDNDRHNEFLDHNETDPHHHHHHNHPHEDPDHNNSINLHNQEDHNTNHDHHNHNHFDDPDHNHDGLENKNISANISETNNEDMNKKPQISNIIKEEHTINPKFKREVPTQTHNYLNESEDNHAHEHEQHDHGHDDEHDHGYPFAELVICLGFFLIYFIEEIIHKTLLKHSDDDHDTKSNLHRTLSGRSVRGRKPHTHIPSSRCHGDRNSSGEVKSALNGHANSGSYQSTRTKTLSPQNGNGGLRGIDNPVFAGDIEATSWNPTLRNTILTEINNQVTPAPTSQPNGNPHNGTALNSSTPLSPLKAKDNGKEPQKDICGHVLAHARSLLVVIALSFHSIFEGMAAGLQEVQKDVWYLFIAIAAHKFVIIFCIGLELLIDGSPLVLYFVYMVGLALVTPLGMGIGIIITEESSAAGLDQSYVISVLQGVAGGTLLYVALLEVLERERSKPGDRLLKLLCLVLGFGLMAAMQSFGGHSHGRAEQAH